jgi:hypothetical protein
LQRRGLDRFLAGVTTARSPSRIKMWNDKTGEVFSTFRWETTMMLIRLHRRGWQQHQVPQVTRNLMINDSIIDEISPRLCLQDRAAVFRISSPDFRKACQFRQKYSC